MIYLLVQSPNTFNFIKPAIKNFISGLCTNQLLAYNIIFFFAMMICIPFAILLYTTKCQVYYCQDNLKLRSWIYKIVGLCYYQSAISKTWCACSKFVHTLFFFKFDLYSEFHHVYNAPYEVLKSTGNKPYSSKYYLRTARILYQLLLSARQ